MNTKKINFNDFLNNKIRKENKTSNVAKVVKVLTDDNGNPLAPQTLEALSQKWAVEKYKEDHDATLFDASNELHTKELNQLVQIGAKHIKRAFRSELNQNSIDFNPKYKTRFTCVYEAETNLYGLKLFGIDAPKKA